MKKLTVLSILAATTLATVLSAQTLFDGASDTLYNASNHGAGQNFDLVNSSGNISYTRNAVSDPANEPGDAGAGYMFGTFTPTAIGVGEYIELSFEIELFASSDPTINFALVGGRADTITGADSDYAGFTRGFGGYEIDQSMGSLGFTMKGGRGAGNLAATSEDRRLINYLGGNSQDINTGNNVFPSSSDRIDAGQSGAFTLRLTNAGGGQWTMGGTARNITDSTVTFDYGDTTFTPDPSFFLTSDEFSAFAIGTWNTTLAEDDGFAISNLTVTAIPEPSSLALLGGALAIVYVACRRRRA